MNNLKKAGKAIAALMMISVLFQVVCADTNEPIDPSRSTILLICLQSLENEIKCEAGAEITVYKVADIKEVSGEIQYTYTDAFADRTEDLSQEVPETVVREMADSAINNAVTGYKGITGSDGTVIFDNLEQAVYLVTQTVTAEGFTAFDPFLSYLPGIEDGVWIYDVKAAPKIEYSSEPDITPMPSPTPDPTVTPTPTPVPGNEPPDQTPPKLPQTGQLNWPIPVLLISGLVFVSLGLIVKRTRKQHDDE